MTWPERNTSATASTARTRSAMIMTDIRGRRSTSDPASGASSSTGRISATITPLTPRAAGQVEHQQRQGDGGEDVAALRSRSGHPELPVAGPGEHHPNPAGSRAGRLRHAQELPEALRFRAHTGALIHSMTV